MRSALVCMMISLSLLCLSVQSVSVRSDGSLRESSRVCPWDSDRLQGQQPEPERQTLHTAQLVPGVSMSRLQLS